MKPFAWGSFHDDGTPRVFESQQWAREYAEREGQECFPLFRETTSARHLAQCRGWDMAAAVYEPAIVRIAGDQVAMLSHDHTSWTWEDGLLVRWIRITLVTGAELKFRIADDDFARFLDELGWT